MGLLDALMGNASDVDSHEVAEELAPVMADNEQVVHAYKMVRDLYVFTNKRLIFIDKQGLTGKKIDYLSVPYKAITSFNVQTAGRFDTDCELSIWMSGKSDPLKVEIAAKLASDVQKTLANCLFS
ncbi:PH domain-containing protein [Glaciecola siphonariae]|uniref:PH domain-containing protein n=1 Tax=Glaciecola siphonariae TaxID=521012 RepID=A0ABV9M1V4_9ALTE